MLAMVFIPPISIEIFADYRNQITSNLLIMRKVTGQSEADSGANFKADIHLYVVCHGGCRYEIKFQAGHKSLKKY
jgi:hypothetical protein